MLVERTARNIVPEVGSVRTVPDYVGNWMAATFGEPGVVVISGGGTVAYGRAADGRSFRAGGWGHLLGDEGSGYWIGLEAIKAALRSKAGVIPKTRLEEQVSRRLGVVGEKDLLRQVRYGVVAHSDITGLAPMVVQEGQAGDEAALRILDTAAGHLADLVAAVMRELGRLPVYLSGGVSNAPTMKERLERCLIERRWSTKVERASADVFRGLYLLARGQHEHAIETKQDEERRRRGA
jgi:N-acetylglucosamine kinase-like BadF-type ATPase